MCGPKGMYINRLYYKSVLFCILAFAGSALPFEERRPLEEPKDASQAQSLVEKTRRQLEEARRQENKLKEALASEEVMQDRERTETQLRLWQLKKEQISLDLTNAETWRDIKSGKIDPVESIDHINDIQDNNQRIEALQKDIKNLFAQLEKTYELPTPPFEPTVLVEQKQGIAESLESPSKTAENLMMFSWPEEEVGPTLSQLAYESTAQFLSSAAETMQNAAQGALKAAVGGLQSMQSIADTLVGFEQNMNTTVQAVEYINKTVEELQPTIALVPNQLVQNIAENAQIGTSAALVYKPVVEQAAGWAGAVGRVLQTGVDYVRTAVDAIQKVVDPRAALTRERAQAEQQTLANVERLIKEKREQLETQNRFAEKVNLRKFTQYIKDWVQKNIFNISNAQRLERAHANYEQARKAYLTALGFEDTQTPQNVIAERLRTMLPEEKSAIRSYIEAFANATRELASINSAMVSRIENVAANYAFLIDAWDIAATKPESEKIEIAQLIESIFDMHAVKMAALDAVQESIGQLEQHTQKLTASNKNLAQLDETFIESITELTDRVRERNLQEHERNIAIMERAISAQREVLEERLRMLQQQN